MSEKFKDLAELDARIPPNFMMKYQGKDYILKAGLEYKATQVFGVGKYGIEMDIVERDDNRIVVKATLTTPLGMKFVNFGECNKLNTPPTMSKYALHLAATRAECRVLRSATACGYVAYEEMDTPEVKEITSMADDNEVATDIQIEALKTMGGTPKEGITRREVRLAIDELGRKK